MSSSGAEKRDRKAMMFLVRMAFWLTLVLVLLPSGRSEPVEGPQVGAADAVSAASATVSDMRQFCSRQPDACALGSQAVTALGHRAQAGAKMIYDFVTARMSQTESAAPGRTTPATAHSVVVQSSENTLSPADIALSWRDPAARRGAQARPSN
jgi:hypothetical protein